MATTVGTAGTARSVAPLERSVVCPSDSNCGRATSPAAVDADEPQVPVVHGRRVDLGGRLERVEARPVADERAADRDVVDEQAALVDPAVADVAEGEQDRLAGVGRQVVASAARSRSSCR